LWLVLLLPLNGMHLLGLFNSRSLSQLARTMLGTGLGLGALMAAGLLLNTAATIFDFAAYQTAIVLPVLNVLLLVPLFLYALKGAQRYTLPVRLGAQPLSIGALVALPPLLSVAGAAQLNNGGAGVVAYISLALSVIIAAGLYVYKKTTNGVFAAALFGISLSLILAVSMRSNYVFGFDINNEYQVFLQTLSNGIWQPVINSPYAACLSITIVPAMLASIIPGDTIFLFKFYLQMILALLPVVVYMIAKDGYRLNPKASFASALLFMAPGQFIFQFPGLIRQQVALLFFGLLMYVLFVADVTRRTRYGLAFIMGGAMVVSHYSTTYVALGLLVLLIGMRYAFRGIIAVLLRLKKRPEVDTHRFAMFALSGRFVIVMLLAAFLWYGQVVQSTGGVVEKVWTSLTGYQQLFKADTQGEFVVGTLRGESSVYTSRDLQRIGEDVSAGDTSLDPNAQTTVLPAFTPGPVLDTPAKEGAFEAIHRYIPLIANSFVIAGVLLVIALSIRDRKLYWNGVVGASVGVLLAAGIVLPSLSQDYNVERAYQQLLLVVAPSLMVLLTMRWIRLQRVMSALRIGIPLAVLVCASGLADQTIFGASNVNLTNNNDLYNRYYISEQQHAGYVWVARNAGDSTIRFDRYSVLGAQAYTTIPADRRAVGLLPSQISSQDYLFASDTNTAKGLSYLFYGGRSYVFEFPEQTIADQKNQIYTNGRTTIYK